LSWRALAGGTFWLELGGAVDALELRAKVRPEVGLRCELGLVGPLASARIWIDGLRVESPEHAGARCYLSPA